MRIITKQKQTFGHRLLGLILALALVIGLFPQLRLGREVSASDTLEVDPTPVYRSDVFDKLRNDYIYNTDSTSRTTVYASAAVLYATSEGNAHVTWGTTYHPGTHDNLRPPVDVYGVGDGNWKMNFDMFDYRLYSEFYNQDVQMYFGATLTSTKNNKPSMTVSGVSIGPDMAKKSTQALEGKAAPSETITVSGGSGTKATGMWAAFIDDSTAVPVLDKITAKFSGSSLTLEIPMDENLRWANTDAGSYAKDIWITVTLKDVLTGIESTENITLYFDGIEDHYSYDSICFSAALNSKWANSHFAVAQITGASIPLKSDMPFEVYGMLGCKEHQVAADREIDYGNASRFIQDFTLETTPITDRAGNRVDLSSLKDVNLLNRNLVFDNLDPQITRVYVAEANGINNLSASRTSGSPESWPEELDRSQLFLAEGKSMVFAALANEPVLTGVNAASSGVSAKLNVLDSTGRQVSLPLTSAEDVGGTQSEKLNNTRLTFATFTAAAGMTMMEGYEGKPIQILQLSGNIADSSGNRLSGAVPAPDEKLYLDVQPPRVTVQKLDTGGNPNILELQITVSDQNSALNAGILEQHTNDALNQNLQLWFTGAGTENYRYQYTLDTYPTASAAVTGSGTLSSQKSVVIPYTMRTMDQITLKLTLTFAQVGAVDELILHAQVQDVVDNKRSEDFVVDYKLDAVAPELNIGAVRYDWKGNTATVTVPVTAEDAHSQVAKLEYRWTDAGDDAGNWETAAITQGKAVAFDIQKTYDDGQNHQQILWVRATDVNGRVSEVKTANVTVNLQQPATAYAYENQADAPQANPSVTVYGPDARSSDAADAYTRITVTLDGKTYVRTVKTGESTDLFRFDGTWYQVTKGESKFTSVSQVVSDELKSYYGPVTVTFENAFTDLTPAKNALIAPEAAGYVADTTELRILYAPDRTDPIHNVTWTACSDVDGTAIEGEGAIAFQQSMSGTRMDFSLSNLLQEDWGITDIDFDRSYLEFSKVEEDGVTVEVRRGLQNMSAVQSFNVPYRNDAGQSFTTGQYQLTVHVAKRDGRTDTYTCSRTLVLDADEPSNQGLWKYYLKDGSQYSTAVSNTAIDMPITSFGMAMGVRQETYRDDVFAYYTNGVGQMTLIMQADEHTVTYDGITVGQVEGFRLWPLAANLSQEQIDAMDFAAPNDREEGKAQFVATFGAALVDNYPQGTDGILTPGQDIMLVKGANVMCYQVKMANGAVSAVGQFTIFVTDGMPILDVSVDSFTESMVLSRIEGQTNVQDITLLVENAFSVNGSGNVNVTLMSYNDVLINGEQVSSGAQLKSGDKITLYDDTYTGRYTEEISRTTKTLLIARDEYGGTVIVAPQIGAEYRIDGNYAVNYRDYPSNHWTNAGYSYIYNQPQYDDDGNITGYQTDIYSDEVPDTSRTTTKTLDYNRYAINTEKPGFSGAGYNDLGAYVRHKHSVAHGDLIDWSTVTLTLPTVGGGTVTLPMDYSGPNDAGFICAEYDPSYGRFNVLIAKPVDDERAGTEAFGYTPFQIHWKDTLGTEHTNAGGYRLEYVSSQPSGSIDRYGYTLRMPTAAYSSAPDAVNCWYSDYAGKYFWEVNTGCYNAGVYSGSYTDMYGKDHTYSVDMEAWEDGLDIQVTPPSTVPTGGSVQVIFRSTRDEAITVGEREGQTVTGNGTSEVTVTLTENGYVSYWTDTIYERGVDINHIYQSDLQIMWSYDVDQVAVDDQGVAYHYGPVTAYLISGNDEVDVVDSYTGEMPSYTFYPGEANSYTFKSSDFTVMLGTTELEYQDFTVTLEVELRNFQNPVEEDASHDDIAPAVQIRAYSQRNGVFADTQKLLHVGPELYLEGMLVHDTDTVFSADSSRADTADYVAALQWASALRFQLEMQDDSKVKLFIKEGLYPSAPDYDSVSDIVPGVTLNGRVLTVTEPVEFTVFAVDEEGNVTTIPLSLSNVGRAPVPRIQKVPGKNVVYAYLLMPEGMNEADIADLKLTYPADVRQAADGDYAGCWYATLTANGTHTLNYSYAYQGQAVDGKLEVEVMELDTVPIELEKDGITWSANKARMRTNQDVSVQLRFTKNVSAVQVPASYADSMEVLITGRCVSVRYDENMAAVELTVVATNGSRVHIPLDAVTNIDKVAPEAQLEAQTLSQDGKTLEVTFLVNEEALMRELGSYGKEISDSVYRYTREHRKNGTYTACFIDPAGNITQLDYEAASIVDQPLKLLFNTASSDEGAMEDPDGMDLLVGDRIYVKANRDCTVSMNGDRNKTATANQWVGFDIEENDAGLWPIIHAVDAFGNTATGQFGSVTLPDRTPPVLALNKNVVVAKAGTDRNELRKLLEENLVVTDRDMNITVTVNFTDDVNAQGTTSVTYLAADSSGNEGTVTGWLRLTSAGEPEVKINAETVDRDTIYLGGTKKLELTVDVYGEPYSVVWKKGVKTVGQMKIGITELLRNETAVKAVELPFTEAGYYTVCIKTQGRDEYRIIVYVG